MWWIFFTCSAVKGSVSQCSGIRSWGHVLAAHLRNKVHVYRVQYLPQTFSQVFFLATQPLCKRSSYCPTDIGNYALWFELLYVKVKLPVTLFPWWQVLFIDQHNYSWADVDIGVTRSLERFCNDNLMVQVVAEGLFYAFWSLTTSDVIGPIRTSCHVISQFLHHRHFKSLLWSSVVVGNGRSRRDINWELSRVRWPLHSFRFTCDPSEPTHTWSGVAVICTATLSVDAETKTGLKSYFCHIWGFWRINSDSELSHFWLRDVFCTLFPPHELTSELQWPAQPKLDMSSNFFYVGLLEDASSHHNYEMRCQAGWIVHI